jgi:hypothetical protein
MYVSIYAVYFIALTNLRQDEVKPLNRFNTLPVEIRQHVFEHAATYSARTYQSLLATSRSTGEMVLNSQALSKFAICITNERKLASFKRFLVAHPNKVAEVRHLMMCTEHGVFDGLDIVQRCTNIVTLACDLELLNKLEPEDCANVSWLTIEMRSSSRDDGDDDDSQGSSAQVSPIRVRFNNLNYLHYGAYSGMNSLSFLHFENVQHLIFEASILGMVTMIMPFARDSLLSLTPPPNVVRIAHLGYWLKDPLGSSIQMFNLGQGNEHIVQSARVDSNSSDWKDIFVRSIEDREYVWKLPIEVSSCCAFLEMFFDVLQEPE